MNLNRFSGRHVMAIMAVIVCGAALHTLPVFAEDTNLDALKSAAEKGDAKAQYDLAVRYAKGDGIQKDAVKATDYLRRSADQGYAFAETDLASRYARGMGVGRDPQQAVEWYRKAAGHGDALGQYGLGWCLVKGIGVGTNVDEGIDWWRKSAESGEAVAQNALGQICMNHGAIDDTNYVNYGESAKWLGRAAGQGYVPAMNNLGFLYQTGWGVGKNLEEAVKWYRTAAEKDDAKAQANLGLMYQDGLGVTKDLVQAYKWFYLSAEQKDVVGRHCLDDYKHNHALTEDQMAEGRRMAAEFRAKLSSNKTTSSN